MINRGYLTRPRLVNAAVAQYDFSTLTQDRFGGYAEKDVNKLLNKHKRVTRAIIEQVMEMAAERQGVMIFAATVEHAREIAGYLPEHESALVTGSTDLRNRDLLIQHFKQRQLKYLVNVSVLTTGFDAPHVDFIAILRPTQSVSLYQQIVGRGLRLDEGKQDCLVIDYAGNHVNLHHPEVGEPKPSPDSEPVQVFCPGCGFANIFWGKTDSDGRVVEHYGRRCQGLLEPEGGENKRLQQCDYRFRFKVCPHCGGENDIAARNCGHCQQAIIDPDDQLRDALNLKGVMVIRCAGVSLAVEGHKLRITYHGEDGEELRESFDFSKPAQCAVFNKLFGRRVAGGQLPKSFTRANEVLEVQPLLPSPDFVIARKKKNYWQVQERIFDYHGQYRKAY